MPDPKRVARIYLRPVAVEMIKNNRMARPISEWFACRPDDSYTVPFEPAVPKCGSCCGFIVDNKDEKPWAYCARTSSIVPTDGSGYCHCCNANPPWATGLSMIEAAELIVQQAIDNANIKEVTSG